MKLRFFGASIQWRVIYALAASLLWWALVEIADSLRYGDYLRFATGGVYAALVLVPYLPSLKGRFMLRALGLMLFGVLSYWSAITIAAVVDFSRVWTLNGQGVAFEVAGAFGAVIIGIGARLFVPLGLRWWGWLLLIGAGLLGALVLDIGFVAGPGVFAGFNYLYWLPGHVAWQVLVCLALYYGSEHE